MTKGQFLYRAMPVPWLTPKIIFRVSVESYAQGLKVLAEGFKKGTQAYLTAHHQG